MNRPLSWLIINCSKSRPCTVLTIAVCPLTTIQFLAIGHTYTKLHNTTARASHNGEFNAPALSLPKSRTLASSRKLAQRDWPAIITTPFSFTSTLFSSAHCTSTTHNTITPPVVQFNLEQTTDRQWRTTRRKAQTSKKPSPSSTSAVPDACSSTAWATYSEHADRIPLWRRLGIWRGRWEGTVSVTPIHPV